MATYLKQQIIGSVENEANNESRMNTTATIIHVKTLQTWMTVANAYDEGYRLTWQLSSFALHITTEHETDLS